MSKTSTDIVKAEDFLPVSAEASAIWAEVMGNAEVEFPTVSTPTAGGVTWEIEGEDPTRELTGVVVDDYEAHVLYLDEYSGEGRPPAGYWIEKELLFLTDEAKAKGYTKDSHTLKGGLVTNRQIIFLARPGQVVPIKIDLTGASCRPWRLFKQNQLASRLKRTTDVVLGLSLEAKKYSSGYTGSLIAPKILAELPADAAAGFKAQADQVKQYTRVRTAPGSGETAFEVEVSSLADEFASAGFGPAGSNDFEAPEVV